MKKIVIDTECYRNFFLLAAMDIETEKVVTVSITEDNPFNHAVAKAIIEKHQTISFNGLSYDLPLIVLALNGCNNNKLKEFSDKLIQSNQTWEVLRDAEIVIPNEWDHIDIMNIAPGKAGLKLYGGRLQSPKLQDLPFEPSSILTSEDMDNLTKYCVNDLRLTAALYRSLMPQIELRETMGELYSLDLRSKGDAQIAESVLKHELQANNIKIGRPAKVPQTFQYDPPSWIKFNDPELQELLQDAKDTVFKVQPTGSVAMPSKLGRKVKYAGAEYTVGIGGLHSNETHITVQPGPDEVLFDADFASYYPSIVLGERYYPKHLGSKFLDIYRSIVKRRLRAKAEGDAVTANSLKIVVNSSFGKFGSKYSFLYSPNLLIGVTVTGQLALLMLIEMVTEAGAKAVSANTDGVVILAHTKDMANVRDAMFIFELQSGYTLEETFYKKIMIESVNNYIAVGLNGKVKGKGCYAPASLQKNPQFPICSEAIREWASSNIDIEDYITSCCEPHKFLSIRKVTGGGVWKEDQLGKVVRWYVSSDKEAEPIRYSKNGNKVPRTDNAKPMMDLSNAVPVDLDRTWYVAEAMKMVKKMGTTCSKKILNNHL